MIAGVVAAASLGVWLYLMLLHGGFWRANVTDAAAAPAPAQWPAVVAVVPARDEAAVITRAIASLVAQDYPGAFRIILVDDGSGDGTAEIARRTAEGSGRLEVVRGSALPAAWTGKLWAVNQGIARAGDPEWLWLTDADIAHAPDTLRSLVARGEAEGLVLHSLMAELACVSWAERALVPAFVLFFQMLYPFAWVNDARRGTAGAAGGCMLVRRAALDQAGGIAAIGDALIDDCALGAALKRQGPVRLSLTHRSVSLRGYGSFGEVGTMIARSAYAQLGYSPLLLIGTVAGLALVFLTPPLLGLFGTGWARLAGLAAWALMAIAAMPMLRFYRRSPLWGVALPAIAAFYAGATIWSAVQHVRGRGGMWKGRAQAAIGAAR